MDYIFGEIHMGLQCKAGPWGGGSGEGNAWKNVVWVLPIAKCLNQII